MEINRGPLSTIVIQHFLFFVVVVIIIPLVTHTAAVARV
jgi:hypothetical protein